MLFISLFQPKQSDVEWLLRVVLQTLQKAAKYKLLFQYVPEYYVLTAINTYNALFNFFHPTVPFESLDSKYFIMLKKYFLRNEIMFTIMKRKFKL
jgi:Kip1 ubiquitination-promoting complex protein 1